MKTRTLLLSVLVAASALAVLPSTEATALPIPGPVCVTEPCCPCPPDLVPSDCELKQATPDRLPLLLIPANPRQTVWGSDEGCDIDVKSSANCAPPSGWDIEREVGPLALDLYVCNGGITVPPLDFIRLETNAPVALDVDTRDYYACAPPSAIHVDRNVGQHHVHVHVCDGGIGNLLPDPAVATAQPPIYCVMAPCPGPTPTNPFCTLKQATPGQNPYTTIEPRTIVWGNDPGCDIDVETAWYCLFGGIPVDRTVGPVHVATEVCTLDLPPIQ